MPLCTPTLALPISEWSSTLPVEGCAPGATVTVRSIGPSSRYIAKATIDGCGTVRIGLLAGIKLQADDLLVLMQESAAGMSWETDSRAAYHVAPAPTSFTNLPALGFISHVYECGQALWIGGAVPGAAVTVRRSDGTVIGQGIANEGSARFQLSGQMPSADHTIRTSQAAPAGFPAPSGTAKVATAKVDHIPTPAGKPLQTPVFAGAYPPQGCDPSVCIGNIIDGAKVTIAYSSGRPPDVAIFDCSSAFVDLSAPLPQQGDTLHITQEVGIECKRDPSLPLDLKVLPSQKPHPPIVLPLCPGAIYVWVFNLVLGAHVTITVNGVSYDGWGPADRNWNKFEVQSLPVNAKVDVIQENTCGQKSDKTIVKVKTFGPSKPGLVEPLYECARVVRVKGAQPGAALEIWARTGNDPPRQISDRVTATADSVPIPVTPYLIKSDSVWVQQLACSGGWEPSQHVTVKAAPAQQLSIPFPIEGDNYVIVQALPGSHVDIFTQPQGAQPQFLGGADVDVDPEMQRIDLSRALTLTDRLFGIQTLCFPLRRTDELVAVLPATKTFTLAASIIREGNSDLSLLWNTGTLVCHHDGRWMLTAHIANQATSADVDFTFRVTLAFKVGGHQFDHSWKEKLSAAGSGLINTIGYRAQGFPPEQTYMIQENFAPFREPSYWSNILNTTATFDIPDSPPGTLVWNVVSPDGSEEDGSEEGGTNGGGGSGEGEGSGDGG